MKNQTPLSSLLKQLFADSKSYIGIRANLLKLEAVDKLARLIGTLVFLFVALFLGFGALAYLSVALVSWLSTYMSTIIACLILALVFAIALYITYMVRQQLFINSFIRLLSSMFFEDDETNITPQTTINEPTKQQENEKSDIAQ